jgi:hypothetical protein
MNLEIKIHPPGFGLGGLPMIHIYLSKKGHNEYEIWRDQKPTGEIVDVSFIRIKLLRREQFAQFLKGENLIFYIEGQRWRRRNYKTERKKSSNLPDDEKPRKYHIASTSGAGSRVQ